MVTTAGPPSDKAEESVGVAADQIRTQVAVHPTAPGRPKSTQKTIIDYCATALVILLGSAFLRWSFLPEETRYLFPSSADDWVAWGTWAGATGAVLAVVYAARSVRQALAAQSIQERQREEDRIVREDAAAQAKQTQEEARADAIKERNEAWERERKKRDLAWNREREEREKEREAESIQRANDLAQEAISRQNERDIDTALRRTEHDDDLQERKNIQQNLDEQARAAASRLTWKVSTGFPSDSQYLSHQPDYKAQTDTPAGPSTEDEARSDVISQLFILIGNASNSTRFSELSLRLLEPAVTAKVTGIANRRTPPDWDGVKYLDGRPPEWQEMPMAKYAPIYLPVTNQWALDCPPPGDELLVTLDFGSPEERLHWLWNRKLGEDLDAPSGGHLILAYTDPAQCCWIRSTHAALDRPFRVWELNQKSSR